ncbi:hypothetical protein N0V84_007251 [Fusarium piperis]|uniref:Uncharacterized protein n=1 Tax=Fusarium piperis TaxID=1435070 RepID=A0A9W9BNL2_9HYPO|nr:hypothetical protein N0V84_007251 [Fusarium piperis]
MTSSSWDPANLLQITDDLRSRSGEISCLGITKHGARCRWDVLEPNLSEVRPLLRDMSQVKPESITAETLRKLARLCLCPKFHSHQAEQFVYHWTAVLKTATQHHKKLLEDNNSPSSDTVQTLEHRLAFKQRECEDLEKKLDREIVSNTRLSDEWREKSSEMTTEITHLKHQIDEHEHHILTAVQAMLDQKKAAQTLIEQRKEESANRDKAERENTILQSKLKASQDKLKRVREENENLIEELATVVESNDVEMKSCQDEIDQLKATERDLTKERDAGDAMLQQYRAQIAKQLAQNTLLDDRIASLEAAQARLEASIASCWVHAFWGWTSRFKGRRNGSGHLGGKTEEIALKTYA